MPFNNKERDVDTTRLSPISYSYAHVKLRRARGRAADQDCVDCGHQASQWSYDGNDPNEQSGPHPDAWARRNKEANNVTWTPNVFAYSPRCVPCHRAYDA